MADSSDPQRLKDEWKQLAAAWIHDVRDGRSAPRKGMLDRYMLEACGDVRGLYVLDSGCGEGRFCRMMVERGASFVLGLDLCEAMIAAAREFESPVQQYRVANVEDLSFLEDGRFDLAISYLNQCDLVDFRANTREVQRVLKPGGRFVIANLHPMRSAVGNWIRNPDGSKQHVILDRYFDESARQWRMLNVDFTNFHRSLSTYINAFIDAGFTLERLIEPTMTPEALQKYPELDDEVRVPNFIVFVLGKRGE